MAKLDLASNSAAGRLSGDGLAGVTRGGSDVETDGHWQSRGGSDRFKEFELLLTIQNLKFHNGTRILAKIEVVEDKKGLQLSFWAKIDSKPGLRTKTRSNAANSKVILKT